ncbi:MarR family winged helix-turn-helix transcriptional regulator [Aliamphritea ceti]|uniref:MarR family winged helix-turn-helix transcriptional regulator n=1 Tax=Aliamphritea ceti TaxID=1524258 RepID=UPI0021C26B20|nr:MarR family transcriptional regulator [Aliamphritea ceti]
MTDKLSAVSQENVAGDAVDKIISQWQAQRPDLDLEGMATIGRVKRCAALLQPKLESVFKQFDLSFWEFDVLATLRRSGDDCCLSPTELFSTMMITSGTMTHRMKQLESRGLVERLPNPQDARSMLVKLTAEGFSKVDAAVTAHTINEKQILAGLPAEKLAALDIALVELLKVLEE